MTAVAHGFNPKGRLSGDQISNIYEELIVIRLLKESLPLHSFENAVLEESPCNEVNSNPLKKNGDLQ